MVLLSEQVVDIFAGLKVQKRYLIYIWNCISEDLNYGNSQPKIRRFRLFPGGSSKLHALTCP